MLGNCIHLSNQCLRTTDLTHSETAADYTAVNGSQSSDAFSKFQACKVSKKFSGHISPFMHTETKVFAVKFKRIFEVFGLQGFLDMFLQHCYNSCVHRQNCLLWSSDTFVSSLLAKFPQNVLEVFSSWGFSIWKSSTWEVFTKRFWAHYTIFTFGNEAVWCGIQTQINTLKSKVDTKGTALKE